MFGICAYDTRYLICVIREINNKQETLLIKRFVFDFLFGKMDHRKLSSGVLTGEISQPISSDSDSKSSSLNSKLGQDSVSLSN